MQRERALREAHDRQVHPLSNNELHIAYLFNYKAFIQNVPPRQY